MRAHVLEHDGERLARELGSGAADVAQIVSEVRDRVSVDPPVPGNPEEVRFRLFQAVTAFLRNASVMQPICLVLEDLHDADQGTMEMLVHLARYMSGARLLIIGTYRDVEVDRTHPLSAALAEFRRVESFQRIALRGLSPDEVQRMLSNITGQEVPRELAEAIFRQTEGNPLFTQEMIRNAAEEGLIKREGGQWVATVESLLNYIPEGLRDVIGRRLSRLSESCNKVLSVAAVIGRDFSVQVLQMVAGVSEDDVLIAIEEATRVSLLDEMPGQREIRYRFTHAFFRQTLYEEMIAPRRLRLHNEVAKALEAHYGGRVEDHAAELAEHFSHSSSEEDLQKAVEYSELAAARASEVYAYGEAARLLQQALEVQEVLDPRADERRYDLLMELARVLGSSGQAKRVFEVVSPQAFEIALRLGGGERAAVAADFALVAMIYHHGSVAFAMPEYRSWGEKMDEHAPPDSRERVIADCQNSWIHWTAMEQAKCWQLRRRALDLARKIKDPEALALAMFCFIVVGGPMDWEEERLKVAQELQDLPRASIRPALLGQLLYSLAEIFVNNGDREAADRIWKELDEYAKRVGDPFVHAWQVICEGYRLGMRGEMEKVVALGRDLSDNAEALGIPTWGQLVGAWTRSSALADLGRFDELIAEHWSWASLPYGDAIIASNLAQAGKFDEARAIVRRVIQSRGFGQPDDFAEGQSLITLLLAAGLSGDSESATMLEKRLEGKAGWYGVKSSTAGRPMALAALLRGDAAKAREYLVTALQTAKTVQDRTEIAKVRFTMAQVLFAHFPDDRVEAAEHLNYAVQEFGAMKMQRYLEEAMRLKLEFQGITSTDINTSIDVVARQVHAEQPDLRTHAAPDGTVTILFSDIEGSTALADRLGDKRFMDVLREHNVIVRQKVRKYGGFEVKSEGDGFMLAFQSARRALDCAIAIQMALAERNATAEEPVRVRMGLHCGEAIRESAQGKEDFFGRNVILAARIAAQAQGGEVLVSSVMKALVESAGDLTFGNPREAELKGLAGTHVIHELMWSQSLVVAADGEAPAPIGAAPQSSVAYCTTEDGVSIAYTSYGNGPAVVFIPYFTESFGMQSVVPEEQRFYEHLARGLRIVRYDGRGTGLSQREVEDFSHEANLRDLDAVIKALDLREFTLWGQVLGGPRAIEYAAKHPELDIRLILVATFANAADVMPREQLEALMALSRANWEMASQLFADMVGREESDVNLRRGQMFRESASGEVCARMLESIYAVDVTALLPDVKGETLILQRKHDPLFRFELGEQIASRTPHARLVALEGETMMYDPRDVDSLAAEVDAFLKQS
jgi:class 3 adenylate cyclase/pimeloyl-ACP methyl ester carboxylesterase